MESKIITTESLKEIKTNQETLLKELNSIKYLFVILLISLNISMGLFTRVLMDKMNTISNSSLEERK